ncbi:MAG: alpha/beta hydrolase family protein [Sporichthyaceae bacterium]
MPFGPHPDHVVEVLEPDTDPRALVIVIHGGFWHATYDRGHTAGQCLGLAQAGYAVAAVEYRRIGGGGGWPHTFADLALAVDLVPQLVPARPVVLVGHSAGGHLALWAAGRHRLAAGAPGRLEVPPTLAGVVALGALADLGWAHRHGVGSSVLLDLVGSAPDDDPEQHWAAADPARLLPTGARTILVHGADDGPVPIGGAIAYVEAARALGDPCELRTLPGVGHFEFLDPASSAWAATAEAIADLLI